MMMSPRRCMKDPDDALRNNISKVLPLLECLE